ncbi:MAG: hypothetical protein IJX99_08160 [Clostridia bacterium]|nr:hypothetical protein [Clostridia bacterium]
MEEVVMVDTAMPDVAMSYDAISVQDSEFVTDEMNNSSDVTGSQIALYIVIGVCAIIGIVLGIILGKKAAYK